MRRSWRLSIAASFVAGVLLGCVDRRLDAEADETEEFPTCLTLFGYGHWDDGRSHALQNENEDTSFICMCMTREEMGDLATFADVEVFIEHEINLRTFEECERISALWEFDEDPCQEYYETGRWRSSLSIADDDEAYQNREGLTCGDEGEGEELGCALERGPASPTWLLMLAGVLGLRRRRLARASSTPRRSPPSR